MGWDADGFCGRCQLQLAECKCPRAATERKRRAARDADPPAPQTRRVPTSAGELPPHPGDDRPVWRGGQSSGDPIGMAPWPDSPNGQQAAAEPPEPVTLPEIPGYPVNSIPGPLRQLVSAAVAMGLHAPFAGGAGLAALASVAAPADLVISGSWTVRAALWVPLVDMPSTGKTPALKWGFGALRRLDDALMEDWRRAYAEWKQECKQIADRYLQEVAAWEDFGTKVVAAQGTLIAGDDAKPKRPPKPKAPQVPAAPAKPHRRLTTDATTEVLCRWLDEDDGSGGIVADELKTFIHGLGYYGVGHGGRDYGRYMELWSCQPWSMQRVGQGGASIGIDLYIPRPVVTICGCLTLDNAQLLGREGDGFRPRWLLHLGPGTFPQPTDAEPSVPDWDDTIGALYTDRRPRTWYLQGKARTLWELAAREWKARSRQPEPPSVVAALGKADEQCARIALVLAESLLPGAGGSIPQEAMTGAIAIMNYVLGCWGALLGGGTFALSRSGEMLNQAVDELVSWLEMQPDRKASRSDILRAHVAKVRKAKDLNIILDDYESTYPGCVQRGETPQGGGIAPVVVYAPARRTVLPMATPSAHTSESGSHARETAGHGTVSPGRDGVAIGNTVSGNTVLATPSPGLGGTWADQQAASEAAARRHPTPLDIPPRKGGGQ